MREIDKLREWSHQYDNAWLQKDGSIILTTNTNGVYYGENYGEYIRSMLDAIEQAIADRYMELPLDIEGRPWHIGDKVGGGHGVVKEMCLTERGWHFCGITAIDPSLHAHAKPDTIEDVLADFAAEVENGNNTYETARRYAELIERMVRDDRVRDRLERP